MPNKAIDTKHLSTAAKHLKAAVGILQNNWRRLCDGAEGHYDVWVGNAIGLHVAGDVGVVLHGDPEPVEQTTTGYINALLLARKWFAPIVTDPIQVRMFHPAELDNVEMTINPETYVVEPGDMMACRTYDLSHIFLARDELMKARDALRLHYANDRAFGMLPRNDMDNARERPTNPANSPSRRAAAQRAQRSPVANARVPRVRSTEANARVTRNTANVQRVPVELGGGRKARR